MGRDACKAKAPQALAHGAGTSRQNQASGTAAPISVDTANDAHNPIRWRAAFLAIATHAHPFTVVRSRLIAQRLAYAHFGFSEHTRM